MQALELGRDMHDLEIHLEHGQLIKGRMKQLEALHARAYDGATRKQIEKTYAAVRPQCATDAEAYRAVVEKLPALGLTEHSAAPHQASSRRAELNRDARKFMRAQMVNA